MPDSYPLLGKRERNKRDKLERIIDAASALFGEHGIDHVTLQQIAEGAGVGKGTLFLYARNKGELVLLVQNAHYDDALRRGVERAAREADARGAVAAIVREIVFCNRIHVDNGRNYLREILFGSTENPHRRRALEIVSAADHAIARALAGTVDTVDDLSLRRAEVISHIMFMTMALSENAGVPDEDLIADILSGAALLIPFARIDGDRSTGLEGVTDAS